jgi:glycosyltransferase involved in cell wall biosynthesis
MTIIEAQSLGAIPIVASSVTTEKIVDHGVNGFLYTPGNEADLLSVIDLFESLSIESLNTLSKNVQAHFLKTHSSEQHTKAITAIYSKLSA